MIKIFIKNKLTEEISKTRFVSTVSRAIGKFIFNQFKQFPELYVKEDEYSFKINDLEEVKKREELKNLNDLVVNINKKDLKEDQYFKFEKAYYHPGKKFVELNIIFDSKIKNFNDIPKTYYESFLNIIYGLLWHEIFHYLQFNVFSKPDLSQDPQGNSKRFSSLNFPMTTLHVDISPLSDAQKEEYEYLTTPDEIEAYVTDTVRSHKREKTSFIEEFKSRIRSYRKNIFNTPETIPYYYVIQYNFLKYAVERYSYLRKDIGVQEYYQKIIKIIKNTFKKGGARKQ